MPATSIKSGSSVLAGAILWLCCFQFFVAEQIVRHSWTTPYSFSRNVISDLGAAGCTMHPVSSIHYVCSPRHDLMNASFILQGLLIMGGAFCLASAFPSGRRSAMGLWLVGMAGASVIGVGIAPEDTRPGAHVIAAAIHFICGNAGMIAIGRTLLYEARKLMAVHEIAGRGSIIAGSIGFAGLALLVLCPISGWDARGSVERLAAYPFPLWLTGMGILLIINRHDLQN